MKLEPIRNPHSKIGQEKKKTKIEEKEELIEKTKRTALDKYGVRRCVADSFVEKSSGEEVHADDCHDWHRIKRILFSVT